MPSPSYAELRRCLLAVTVLHDLDLQLTPDGAVLAGKPPVPVDWEQCRQALGDAEAGSDSGRRRLARWLQVRRWLADLPTEQLQERLRPVGVPVGGDRHPGPEWVQAQVLGGALDLGLGVLGLDPADPDGVLLVGPLAGAEVAWPGAQTYLERMGALAAERWQRDPRGRLLPYGSCDVLTLLGSRTLRRALAATSGGMSTAVVPMRTRGWTRLSLVDPSFAVAAAAATEPADRGFPRPLLVTADEVVLAADGGRPARLLQEQGSR